MGREGRQVKRGHEPLRARFTGLSQGVTLFSSIKGPYQAVVKVRFGEHDRPAGGVVLSGARATGLSFPLWRAGAPCERMRPCRRTQRLRAGPRWPRRGRERHPQLGHCRGAPTKRRSTSTRRKNGSVVSRHQRRTVKPIWAAACWASCVNVGRGVVISTSPFAVRIPLPYRRRRAFPKGAASHPVMQHPYD